MAGGYTDCCSTGASCLGVPADCSCDEFCFLANDCCSDISTVCTVGENVALCLFACTYLYFILLLLLFIFPNFPGITQRYQVSQIHAPFI